MEESIKNEVNSTSERTDEAETENDETNDVSSVPTTENDDTKEGIDETNNDIEELPSEQRESREDKVIDVKEYPNKEESGHVRTSERVHKQRYNIQPEEIGDCDDKTDQDYK